MRRLPNGGRDAYSYLQVQQYVTHYAERLEESGIGVGDVVTIFAPNGPEWGIAAFAVWKLGAIVAPVHPGNSDLEIRAGLEALNPKLVLCYGDSRAIPDQIKIRIDLSDDVGGDLDNGSNGHIDVDSEAVRIYTSGSTGNPKIVCLSHRNIICNVIALSKLMLVDRTDRFLSLLPYTDQHKLR